MVPLASIIPIDLFENILFFVGDVSKLNPGLDRPARRIEMKHLSACSATCVYWANLTRQRMFTHLILQSYEDFCGLQTLLRAPSSSRIYSISALLRSLEVFYKLGDQSWFHSVAGLRASAAPRLHGLGLHIVGPPTPALTAATGRRSVLHPLYFSTPRLLPPTIFHDFYPDVFVEDIHLPNAAALFNLLQDCVSLLPWRLYCRNLTWDHSSRATPSSAGLKAACRREYAMRQMNSWGCTDDILVAFMTQSVPHHELSLRRLGPHLSFADTNHLFEAMIATGRQFTGEDGTPNPFWIESLCHVDSIQKYTAITLQPNDALAFQWQASHFDFMCIASQRQNDISDVHDATYIIMELHHPEDLTEFEDGMRAVDWNAFLYAIRRFPDLSRIVIQHPAQHRESSRKYIIELISRLRAAWEEANDFLELHYYSYEDDSKHWTLVQLDTLLDEDEIKREEAQTRLQDNAGVAVGSE